MKTHDVRRCVGKLALLCLAVAMSTGCVAFNAGRPETFTHTETVVETADVPSSWTVTAARGQTEQSGNTASVGIAAEVLEGHEKLKHEETTLVRIQKRLGIGLFPGASEWYLMPRGALDPAFCRPRTGKHGDGHALYGTSGCDYVVAHLMSLVSGFGIPQVAGTVNTLLVQPFSGWSCNHDLIDEDCLQIGRYSNGKRYADATQSPKIRALQAFSSDERRKMGIMTCYDDRQTMLSSEQMTHLGLVGCHKHQAVFVEPAKAGPKTATGEVETKRRRADVEGPYEAELSIPALGWSRTVRVGKGATRAEFALPAAERACVAAAVVRFRADGAGSASEVTKGALAKVEGEEYRFDVTLQGGSVAGALVVPKSSGGAYEVVGITPSGNGRYEVRVRIADKSRTFDVGWAVEPDVKRMIREDFVARHPGTGIQHVRELVEWETEEDGAILAYRGWAFSARPVSDGWTYDGGTRRGTVRLRISEGMPAEEAKRWARENIEAIVKEKNVALEAGKAPPEGAVYRSLGESLEGGVLTVEFEAVE